MADLSKITTALGRRDTNPRSDSITITFDPRHDHLTAYTFDVNPVRRAGRHDVVRRHPIQHRLRRGVGSADADHQRRAGPPSFAFRSRRCASASRPARKWSGASTSAATSSGAPRSIAGWRRHAASTDSCRASGTCVLPTPPAPPRRLEVQPFVLARRKHEPALGSTTGCSGGLDMRMGLGTSATLSATVNPDFGQVEQDPAVLNLSVFETFFPEKRPFFIEDSRTFVPPYLQVTTVPFAADRASVPGGCALEDGDIADRAAGADDDPRRHQGDRQGVRLDLRRADRADRSRVRDGRCHDGRRRRA